MAKHIMIDIEGLATTPTAAILTIAAQAFDPFTQGYDDQEHFYARVTLESQENRAITDATIDWWATQKAAAAEAFNPEGRLDLGDALAGLHRLCWHADFVWANGPCYDMNILEDAYKSLGRVQPWQFYRVRDARTVYSLWPDCPKPATEHHALADCRRQIVMLQQTLAHLNVKEIR